MFRTAATLSPRGSVLPNVLRFDASDLEAAREAVFFFFFLRVFTQTWR